MAAAVTGAVVEAKVPRRKWGPILKRAAEIVQVL
jgi:hypothetical protein